MHINKQRLQHPQGGELPLCCLQPIPPLSGNGSQLNASHFNWRTRAKDCWKPLVSGDPNGVGLPFLVDI